MTSISFNKPYVIGNELAAIADAMERRHLSGDGKYTKHCEAWLADRLGSPHVALTHSCTAALEMAAILLDLGKGDEVIMPSFTFSSTANAVVLRGATPVFADVEPGTMNVSAAAIEPLLNEATKAIFVIHYAGRPADMDAIGALAAARGIAVVEDAAQSLGSTYKGRPAGTHSDLSAISFHETKNVVSGEGGALVINDAKYAARAAILREKGTNRAAYIEGLVDKYTWVDIGSSFLPSELIAAYLSCQLDAVDQISEDRLRSWNTYHKNLGSAVAQFGITLPDLPSDDVTLNGHIFHILLEQAGQRPLFLDAMRKRGVHCTFHYAPLHASPAGRRFGSAPEGCPVTEDCAARLVRLPLYFQMGQSAIDEVVDATFETLRGLTP